MGHALRKDDLDPTKVLKGSGSSTPQQIIHMIAASRDGVSATELKSLLAEIGLHMTELADILPISYSSLTKLSLFSPEVSERIYQIAVVFREGISTFEDKDIFRTWLQKPNRALGGQVPFGLLASSMGIGLVREELLRIEHGLYA